MKPALLDVLRCPVCSSELRVAGARRDGDAAAIESGTLACPSCAGSFPVEGGMPLMLDDRLPGIADKRREIDAWPEKARQEGWYKVDDEVDLTLPDVTWDDPVWRANAKSFQVLLERYVHPGMRVLEVGAARCWGALHLVPRGCEYVASDILADPLIGLGRGEFYEQRVGHFERVQADGEHLPFADASFDLTYCVASLHHALDAPRMVREMTRVTRRGGMVAALNEGTRPPGWSSDAPQQQAEKDLGINEHVHTMWMYVGSFLRAGLAVVRVEHADGFDLLAQQRMGRRLLRLPGGKLWATLWAQNFHGYSGVSVYGKKLRRA